MKYFLIFAWIVTVFRADADPEHRRVRLSAEVTVRAEILRLSDLLPADAGPRLETAAERVSLGRAPQIGSLRVFTGSELRQAIAEVSQGMTEIEAPEQVVVRRQSWPLETENVRRALARSTLTHSLNFSEAKIVLSPGFAATTRDPRLEITTLGSSAGRLLVSMRCRDRAAWWKLPGATLECPRRCRSFP